MLNKQSIALRFVYPSIALVSAMALGPMVLPESSSTPPPAFRRASNLSDLSGMAWLGGDTFLVVHDAKNPDELTQPRVSLVELPVDLTGVTWKRLKWNANTFKSNDLESAARIPGTNDVLLCESGDDGSDFQRIFRVRIKGQKMTIQRQAVWPRSIFNVEASAIAKLGSVFVFLYAERAESQPSTHIQWAVFDPQTLQFGPFRAVAFNNPSPRANRPIVAMDVDSNGQIYIAAAFDAETAGFPDPDNGPFGSSVWRVGQVSMIRGQPWVRLRAAPALQATLDGLKVESIALREDSRGLSVFVGFDDENYGASLRMLPPPPP